MVTELNFGLIERDEVGTMQGASHQHHPPRMIYCPLAAALLDGLG